MIEQATSAADIERIVPAGKIAGVLTIEGGHQIDNELPVLRQYRRMGIMAMTLTHFKNNDWADSSTDNAAHNGLTDFGKQVVREMNRIGMIVDVSHVSDKIFFDTLAITTKPVILSHSSCRVISEVPRNVTEEFKRDMAPTKVSATIADAVAHIDHAVKIAGIDHVGIGSDFDGISGPPKGLEDQSLKLSAISAMLCLLYGIKHSSVHPQPCQQNLH